MNAMTFDYKSLFYPKTLLLALVLALPGCRPKAAPPAQAPERIHYDRGIALLRTGDILNAHADFEMAIRLNPAFAPAYLAQANLEVKTGHRAEAIQDLEALRRAAPHTPHVLCRLAQLHAGNGHFVEALTAAKLALQQEPDCPVAKMQYGLSLADADRRAEAVAMLTSAHQLAPQDEHITLLLAQLLARRGNSAAAWQLVDALPTPSTLPIQSNYLRGWLLAEYGRDGKRDTIQALTLLDQVLATAPNDGPANLEQGRILLRSGDARAALISFQKARDVSEPSVELLSGVAAAQARLKNPAAGKMEQSAQAFAKIVDQLYAARQNYLTAPTNRDNLLKLARLEATMGNGEDAQGLLTEVLKLNPNDTEALKLMTPGGNDVPPVGKTGTASQRRGR